MPPTPDTNLPANSQQGWHGFTNTLARTVPFKLTQGGNARKALYALMYPTKR